MHRLGFSVVKKDDSVLRSDNRPHQGAFEGLSGHMWPEEKCLSKSELLFQQLAAIQDPVASPQVTFKTSPHRSRDNGCVPLFSYADKNQIKIEPHGTYFHISAQRKQLAHRLPTFSCGEVELERVVKQTADKCYVPQETTRGIIPGTGRHIWSQEEGIYDAD